MSESTNRLSLDADQQVPRVIKRGSLTGSLVAGSGSFFQADGLSYIIDDLDQTVNSWIEAWVVLSDGLCELPFATVNASSGEVDISGGIGVSRSPNAVGGYSTQIEFDIFRSLTYGTLGDTFTVYYIVYSTKVTEERLV